ncbi:MAG: hypothetical protein H6585_05870 [Flavobacteriales bacterium]|nr:hypothetical protein [Flavobacteriales bacterium]MCB9447858.1 hypothetical protein [Flavobacteriales bacterium]
MIQPREQYVLSGVTAADEFHLNKDVFLILLHARRVPPHIYLSVAGKIFSLGVKGPMVDGHMAQMLRFIKSQRAETLFIELMLPPVFSIPQLLERIRKITLGYNRVDEGITTCLTPVRDFCDEVYGTGKSDVNLIFDLLPKLQKRQVVGAIYQQHLGHVISQGCFAMNRYVVADIYESIYRAKAGIPI